jgi:hypothetical protein
MNVSIKARRDRAKRYPAALAEPAWVAGIAAFLLAAPVPPLQAGEKQEPQVVEKSFPAQGVRQVKASVQVGTLRVETDSPDTVRVKAVRRLEGLTGSEASRWLERARVVVEQQGSAVVVKDIVPKELQKNNQGKSHPRLEVEIHMPADLALEGSMGVGDVQVMGKIGDLTLESGVGNLRLGKLNCSGDTVNAKAGVGDIVMALQSLPQRKVRVEVGVGKVRVSLPSSARASVDLNTGMGRVDSRFPLPTPRRTGLNLGGSLSGNLNGGGIPVEVRVGVGDVLLEKEDH